MKIIITENQKNSLLTESVSDKISKSYKSMKKFTEDVLKETTQVTGLDFGFLLSWGATIGGLMMPIKQFIKGDHPELTSTELSLLITGLSEIHANANMFGGIESTSFKIKYKQINSRGKQILKHLIEINNSY